MALVLRAPEQVSLMSGRSLVGWSIRLKVMGNDAVDFPDAEATGILFQEQPRPTAALAGMGLLNASAEADPANRKYFRVKNSYSEQDRSLEYAVTFVSNEISEEAHPQLMLMPGKQMLLGALTIRGSGIGTTRVTVDSTDPDSSILVMANPAGELSATDLARQDSLAQVNVGPAAEKLRLEGQALSDVPDDVNSHLPFTRPFRIEVWVQGAIPKWQGGADQPLATFDSVRPDNNGNFVVRDLPAEFIQAGTYDLRVTGDGTLSFLYRNVRIDPSIHQHGASPQVVSVVLGPFPSGDLDGDNLVNDDDLSLLKASFGKEVYATDSRTIADFNADGVVDGQDFSLMAVNYGRQGE